jgi:uncharacterized protein (TIGR00369 family)
VTIDLMQAELARTRSRVHANCIVCSPSNRRGLALEFALSTDGSVEATFDCDEAFEGYAKVLHGGVVSSLLDGAMTSCMFAHGRPAVTAQLDVRFRHAIVTGRTAAVRAWVTRWAPPLYILEAEVSQDSQVKATATGKFMDQPGLAGEWQGEDGSGGVARDAGWTDGSARTGRVDRDRTSSER